jgi:Bardet-Biedl syndrome 7 protein
MITDLYIDKYKFSGLNVRSKIPMLIEKLDSNNIDDVIAFFNQN